MRIRNADVKQIKRKFLIPDPLNWHSHPESQHDALTAVFSEVGFVGHILVRPAEQRNRWHIVDGHERVEHFGPDDTVPCCVLDVDEDEARKLLLAYDPIGYMGAVDEARLEELRASVTFDMDELGAGIDEALDRLRGEMADEPVPEFDPVGIEEQSRLDEKTPIVCPHCKAEFVPR